MPDTPEYLPIKVVLPSPGDLKPPLGGGGKKKDFTPNFDESQRVLLSGLDSAMAHFQTAFRESRLPGIARIQLRDDAIAKSHFPSDFLHRANCPIIGHDDFSDILVQVRKETLESLRRVTQGASDQKIKNDISKISGFEPYSGGDALGAWTADDLVRELSIRSHKYLKLRAFNYKDTSLNLRLESELKSLARKLQISEPQLLNYGNGLRIYKLEIPQATRAIVELSEFIGTQSLDQFEEFTVSDQAVQVERMESRHLPAPQEGMVYPIVGVIDTGTDPNNLLLQNWVLARDESCVPRIDQNNSHGSFVSGLIINGRGLNHDHPGFPEGGAKIVDFVGLTPNGTVLESDLVDIVRTALETYPDPKVWNLSLNSPKRRCRNDRFSDFAIALDGLQDEFGVLIVNSVGNYANKPFHNWPRPDLAEADRMLAPSDSIRAISVGSIAHIERHNACSKIFEPSAFSRRGPGAGFVPKPEVCHIGGNVTKESLYTQMGVLSVDSGGFISENVGTSFAAPLVSLTAAQLIAGLEEPPSRHLVKALIVHSSVLHSDQDIGAKNLPYYGFGKPPTASEILRCRPWEATMIFNVSLPYITRNFHKYDFPIPQCLKKGSKVFGELIMTLCYDPPLDANDGAAYSQVNVDASLGSVTMKNGKPAYSRKVIPYPKDFSEMFEKQQIEHGFKWSPLKVYKTSMQRVECGDKWRISLEFIARRLSFTPAMQDVALVVTLRDPERKQPVYNEVIREMAQSGWVTENLQVREEVRSRVR